MRDFFRLVALAAIFVLTLLFLLFVINGPPGSFNRTNKNYAEKQTIFPVGVTPHGIALTPDGNYAYVANNNNYGITGSDSITVLNLRTKSICTTIHHTSFAEPYTITINDKGTFAYVTNSNASTVSVIDIETNTVVGVINGFDGPSGLTILPGSNIAYVNNYGGPGGVGSGNGKTVQMVNLKTNAISGTPLTVGLAPAAIQASPCGNFVYTINYTTGLPGTGTMSVITTKTNTVTVNAVTGLFGPFAFVIDKRGKFAYVSNFGSNNFAPYGTTVSVVDLSSLRIVNTIALGIQPSGIALHEKSHKTVLLVANYNTLYAGADFSNLTAGEGTVQCFALDRCRGIKLVRTVLVGQSPSQIVVSKRKVLVSNYSSNTIHMFDV